jgi:excisionase family DNA binding protein
MRSSARLVYTVTETAEILGVGRSTAYDLIARGEIKVLRLGHRLFITRPVLTELLGSEPPLPEGPTSTRARRTRSLSDATASRSA